MGNAPFRAPARQQPCPAFGPFALRRCSLERGEGDELADDSGIQVHWDATLSRLAPQSANGQGKEQPLQPPVLRVTAEQLQLLYPVADIATDCDIHIGSSDSENAEAIITVLANRGSSAVSYSEAELEEHIYALCRSGELHYAACAAVDLDLLSVACLRATSNRDVEREAPREVEITFQSVGQHGLARYLASVLEDAGLEIVGLGVAWRGCGVTLTFCAHGTEEAIACTRERLGCSTGSSARRGVPPFQRANGTLGELYAPGDVEAEDDEFEADGMQLLRCGQLFEANGDAYVGDLRDGMRDGFGISYAGCQGSELPRFLYRGQWQCDRPHGAGIEEADGVAFCGLFDSGAHGSCGIEFSRLNCGKNAVMICRGSVREPLFDALCTKLMPADILHGGDTVFDKSLRSLEAPGKCARSRIKSVNPSEASTMSDQSTKSYSSSSSSVGDESCSEALSNVEKFEASMRSSMHAYKKTKWGLPCAEEEDSAPGSWRAPVSLWDTETLVSLCGLLGFDLSGRCASKEAWSAADLLEKPRSFPHSTREHIECWVLCDVLRRLVELDALHRDRLQVPSGRNALLEEPLLRPHLVFSDELDVLAVIGKGGYGYVRHGIFCAKRTRGHLTEGDEVYVAVKESMRDGSELLHEARLLASLKHPNICGMVGISAGRKAGNGGELLLEIADGSLFNLVHFPERLPGAPHLSIVNTLKAMRGVASALEYLHARGVTHGDMKSANILVDYWAGPLRLRLCDFGNAALVSAPRTHHHCGTLWWAAPEALRGEPIGPASDIFSLGSVLWETLTGRMPHNHLSAGQVIAAVGWGGLRPDVRLLEGPARLRELLRCCFCFDPGRRPTAGDLRRELRAVAKEAQAGALALLSAFACR